MEHLPPGPRNAVTDVGGISVGHAHRIGDGWLSGTTVVLAPPGGCVTAVDVRGGGPATRETEALRPGGLVSRIEGVVLTGGSAYGLDAASGAVRWLEEQQRGVRVGSRPHEVVPVVPAAALFDLGRGGDFSKRPDTDLGYAAAHAAAESPPGSLVVEGCVGAGTGAVLGAMSGLLKGGVGTASAILPDGPVVAALVAVNAAGSGVDFDTGQLYGAALARPGEFPPPTADRVAAARARLAASPGASPLNTTIGVVATSAALGRAEAERLAVAAHDGIARAIHPAHTLFDGDTLFALSTGEHSLPDETDPTRAQRLAQLHAAAADLVAIAIARALLAATPLESAPPTYTELYL